MEEAQAVGIIGLLIFGFIGWILIIYWTLWLMRFADHRWPGRTGRVMSISMLGFATLSLGGWLVATVFWVLSALRHRFVPSGPFGS